MTLIQIVSAYRGCNDLISQAKLTAADSYAVKRRINQMLPHVKLFNEELGELAKKHNVTLPVVPGQHLPFEFINAQEELVSKEVEEDGITRFKWSFIEGLKNDDGEPIHVQGITWDAIFPLVADPPDGD